MFLGESARGLDGNAEVALRGVEVPLLQVGGATVDISETLLGRFGGHRVPLVGRGEKREQDSCEECRVPHRQKFRGFAPTVI